MDIKVSGLSELKGNITCSGAKNAAIPLLCASLLAKGKVLLRNVPRISDIFDICKILTHLDCKVVFKGHTMLIDNTYLKYKPLLFEECKKLRGSYYFIGVFLSLFSKCEIWLPGGCKIGSRPIDVHLQAFTDMGFSYTIEENILSIYKTRVVENVNITLTKKSVGASMNAVFAGLSLNNFSIKNVLFEPEGKDVLSFLQKIGYPLTLEEDQVKYNQTKLEFRWIKHTILPDRMEAMTYTILGLLKGDIAIRKVNTKDLEYPLSLLQNAGFHLVFSDTEIFAKKSYGNPMHIVTDIYPGFPTDLQSLIGVLFVNTIGKSEIEETIFENRMHIYYDLIESGVTCTINHNKAIVEGTQHILSKNYKAYDLRHGAALMILALLGDKESVISNFEYVLRGYDDILNKIKSLGGKVSILN